jgi:hypothetical protein
MGSENQKMICRFVKPLLQKYIASDFGKSELGFARPASIRRGGSRLSRTRGGMRWTRGRLRDWQRARGRPSRVVLAPRRWCQVCGTTVPQAMVAKKPGTPGRARSNRNTIAQGMPVCFRRTCGEYARMLCFYLHARLRVRLASGIPCALLIEGARILAKPRARGAARSRRCVFSPPHSAQERVGGGERQTRLSENSYQHTHCRPGQRAGTHNHKCPCCGTLERQPRS